MQVDGARTASMEHPLAVRKGSTDGPHPTKVDRSEFQPWDGSGTTPITHAIGGAFMGFLLAGLPSVGIMALGGATTFSIVLGAGLLATGTVAGAVISVNNERDWLSDQWDARETKRVGTDIDELVDDQMRYYDDDLDGAITRPYEWRTDDFEPPGEEFLRYIDYTPRFERADRGDGSVSRRDLVEKYQAFDRDRNGGISTAEQPAVDAWWNTEVERMSRANHVEG